MARPGVPTSFVSSFNESRSEGLAGSPDVTVLEPGAGTRSRLVLRRTASRARALFRRRAAGPAESRPAQLAQRGAAPRDAAQIGTGDEGSQVRGVKFSSEAEGGDTGHKRPCRDDRTSHRRRQHDTVIDGLDDEGAVVHCRVGRLCWWDRAAEPPPAAGFTQVAFGNSATVGVGALDPSNGFVARAAKLVTENTGQPVDLVNLASSGATGNDVLQKQLPQIDALSADVVLFCTCCVAAPTTSPPRSHSELRNGGPAKVTACFHPLRCAKKSRPSVYECGLGSHPIVRLSDRSGLSAILGHAMSLTRTVARR